MKTRDSLWVLTTALLVMTLFQAYRATFPLVRSLAESTLYLVGGGTAIAVFAATMLAGFLGRRVRTSGYRLATVSVFAVLYLVEVLVARPTVYVMLATCFFGVLALGAMLAAPQAPRGALAATAVLIGGSLDAITKTIFATWDPIWHSGLLALLWCLLPTIALIVVNWMAANVPLEGNREDTEPMVGVAGMGVWMALLFIALGNTAMVAANGGLSLPIASLVVLLGWVLAIAALRVRAEGLVVVLLGAVVTAAAVLMPVSTGLVTPLLSLVGMAAAAPLLAAVLRGRPPRSKRELPAGVFPGGGMTVTGVGLGVFLFTIVQFLYQYHYAQNLPFWNNWVLLVPGLALLLFALPARARVGWDDAPTTAVAVPAAGVVVVPAFLALTAPSVANASAETINMVNYNIHEGVSNNGPGAPPVALDLEAIAQTIERTKPNVVALQEIGRGWAMSGYTDEGLWLQRRLGMNFAYGKAADTQFGNGVYTSMPMPDSQTIDLGQGNGPMKRSAAGAAVTTDAGDVWVWSVHLQHNEQDGTFNENDRIDQIKTWLDQKKGNERTIVSGDFNAEPGSSPLAFMTGAAFVNGQYDSGVVVAGERPDITYQGPQSDDPAKVEKHLDYIFATKDLTFEAFGIGTSQASDHRPLTAILVPAEK